MPEVFWFNDPLILLHPKYLHRFFPNEKLHLNARMNSIVRACSYIGVSLALIQRNVAWLILPLISFGFTASWMYRENPSVMKKNKIRKKIDPDIEYLVSVILEGHPMSSKKYGDLKKKKNKKQVLESRFKNLFRDTDTIMQELQEERAKQSDSVGGRVPDTPNFARKLLGMNR